MNKLKDYRSERPNVYGSTTINHKARLDLEMNCSEYVFMSWLYNRVTKNETPEILDCFQRTGFVEKEQKFLLQKMVEKGFVLPNETDIPGITDKWQSAFADIEHEFEAYFWTKNGKTCWPGSRKNALRLYIGVRKKLSRVYMMKQRNTYFKLLEVEHERGFNRSKMGATVFLGPQERYDENWEQQLEESQAILKKTKGEHEKRKGVEPLTKDAAKDLYKEKK